MYFGFNMVLLLSCCVHIVQLNSNLTHVCQCTRVSARLQHVKLKKLVCAFTVACNFAVHAIASEHT